MTNTAALIADDNSDDNLDDSCTPNNGHDSHKMCL
jgi:hypothetical protein